MGFVDCCGFEHAQTDVCIMDCDENDILLFTQEGRRDEEGEGRDPEAQLIAKATAAFSANMG